MSIVFVDRFGSLSVHCRRVPAGRTTSRALASWLEKTTKPSRDTARDTERTCDFILHLGRFASKIGGPANGSALVICAFNYGLRARVNKEFHASGALALCHEWLKTTTSRTRAKESVPQLLQAADKVLRILPCWRRLRIRLWRGI